MAQFEEEDIGEQTRMFTEEDMCSPLRCALKGAVILVAAPVAAVVFFIPYGGLAISDLLVERNTRHEAQN